MCELGRLVVGLKPPLRERSRNLVLLQRLPFKALATSLFVLLPWIILSVCHQPLLISNLSHASRREASPTLSFLSLREGSTAWPLALTFLRCGLNDVCSNGASCSLVDLRTLDQNQWDLCLSLPPIELSGLVTKPTRNPGDKIQSSRRGARNV